jgi:hypothetical protein
MTRIYWDVMCDTSPYTPTECCCQCPYFRIDQRQKYTEINCSHRKKWNGIGFVCELGHDNNGTCINVYRKNIIDLKVGDIVRSMGQQITVPVRHFIPDFPKNQGYRKTESPCIRLSKLNERWVINTNTLNQSGLVCYVDERFLGLAILSVKITKVNNKSVFAEPVDYLKDFSFLNEKDIGKSLDNLINENIKQGIFLFKAVTGYKGKLDLLNNDLYFIIYRNNINIGSLCRREDRNWSLQIPGTEINLVGQYKNVLIEEAEILYKKFIIRGVH